MEPWPLNLKNLMKNLERQETNVRDWDKTRGSCLPAFYFNLLIFLVKNMLILKDLTPWVCNTQLPLVCFLYVCWLQHGSLPCSTATLELHVDPVSSQLSSGFLSLRCATLVALKGSLLAWPTLTSCLQHRFPKRNELCSSHRLSSCPGMALLEVVRLEVDC